MRNLKSSSHFQQVVETNLNGCSQKERSTALADLGKSMLGTPFHKIVADLKAETERKEEKEANKFVVLSLFGENFSLADF